METRDEAIGYFGRCMDRLRESGWRHAQAHSIALDAGAERFGPAFHALVIEEGLFGLGRGAAKGVGHFVESEHPRDHGKFKEKPGGVHDRAGHKVTQYEHPIGPELPKASDKAKAMMGKIAEYHTRFGGENHELRTRFASGEASGQDLRRMREQAQSALDHYKALPDAQKRDPAERDKSDVAATTVNALRALERELGLSTATARSQAQTVERVVDGKRLRVSADYGSEAWRLRQRSVERSIADPFGHYAYRENA